MLLPRTILTVMDGDTAAALEYWKLNTIRKSEVTYGSVIQSLGGPRPLVDIRRDNDTRWTVRLILCIQISLFPDLVSP